MPNINGLRFVVAVLTYSHSYSQLPRRHTTNNPAYGCVTSRLHSFVAIPHAHHVCPHHVRVFCAYAAILAFVCVCVAFASVLSTAKKHLHIARSPAVEQNHLHATSLVAALKYILLFNSYNLRNAFGLDFIRMHRTFVYIYTAHGVDMFAVRLCLAGLLPASSTGDANSQRRPDGFHIFK